MLRKYRIGRSALNREIKERSLEKTMFELRFKRGMIINVITYSKGKNLGKSEQYNQKS